MARFLKRVVTLVFLLLSVTAYPGELGETVDVGETGFHVKRPVLASACPHGCPWGELGEFVRDAMKVRGYDVILCRNCNRAYGPGLVSTNAFPPPLDRQNLWVGTTTRVNARVDFGITSTDNLAYAYKGIYRYADEGPYDNLRLLARIEDPRWLMVAVKADSGITDLAQIKEQKLGVNMLVNVRRPAIQKLLAYYGLSQEAIESWGGSFGRASILNTDAEFDVIISNNASPANNPEAAYWTAYTWQHDLHFLELPNELLAMLATDTLALERATARWGLLRGVDRSIDTVVRNGHAIFARDDMPDDVAYDIARAVYQHRQALGFYIRPYSYQSARVTHGYGVPLHPGARQFYEEMGSLAPSCVPELFKLPIEKSSVIYRPRGSSQPAGTRIEEEYEFSCTALGHAYRTTFNLTRPARAHAFSGVIVIEPTHPGNLWPVRSTTAEYLDHEGHASITVNSSAFVVNRLVKPVNPTRYASLSVPDSEQMESEILHQLATALKQGNLRLARSPRIILAGYSNTGGRVRTYIDYFRHRYAGVVDGYLVGQTAVGTLPRPLPDLDVPVIELQGEREIIATLNRNPDGLTYRRPDSDTFRLYEVPGMAHLDTSDHERLSFPPSVCGIDTVSSFPLRHIWGSTMNLLVNWVTDGVPAPHAPLITMHEDGKSIMRDEHGNAMGGVPTPQIIVPVASIRTVSEPNPDYPRARCDMIGPQFDFDTEKLTALYGTHQNYTKTLRRSLDRLIEQGWYLPMYRDDVMNTAEKVAARFK